jgi:hypothetical protein
MYAINSAITTRDAAQISGLGLRHIQRLIKTGKLSATKGEDGNYTINKAEFYRVFPDAHTENNPRQQATNSEDIARQLLEIQVKHLQEMNGLLTAQLETANKEKSLLIDTLTSTQRLLEHDNNKQKRRRLFGIFRF